jgi:hypothetical protein
MYLNCVRSLIAVAVLLLMTACSQPPKASPVPSEASGPATPVSGKTAFWAMYKSAYSWAHDLTPLKLESKELPGVKNTDGAAGMWSATFGSYRKHQAVVITYAVAAHPPDVYKGISIGRPMAWEGPEATVAPFQTSDVVIDSDGAYKAALPAAQTWLKKHPQTEVAYVLGNDPTRFATPIWYIQWGDNKSGYSAFVNSQTGALIKKK